MDASQESFPSVSQNNEVSRLWGSRIGEERLFLGVAILIGILSGLAVVAFRTAIDHCYQLLLGSAPPGPRLLLAPTVTGLGWNHRNVLLWLRRKLGARSSRDRILCIARARSSNNLPPVVNFPPRRAAESLFHARSAYHCSDQSLLQSDI